MEGEGVRRRSGKNRSDLVEEEEGVGGGEDVKKVKLKSFCSAENE